MRLTENKGARVAFDSVAGNELESLAAAVGNGGTIFEYGVLAPEPTPFPVLLALAKNLVIRGYNSFSIVGNPESLERGKRFVVDGLATGRLKPMIARTFPLAEIVEAHRYLESNQQIGKVVVTT